MTNLFDIGFDDRGIQVFTLAVAITIGLFIFLLLEIICETKQTKENI